MLVASIVMMILVLIVFLHSLLMIISCHKLNNFRIHPASLGQGGHDHENDVYDVDVFL